MKHRLSAPKRRQGEGGYALLFVVFLTSLLLLATIVAGPSIRTERQREKEQEMIWRGKQYIRAIKLYYRKNGRFPTTLDDLTKPKQGSLRYLRQEYKDPMNKEDGTWRLIYVGPAGQLIGSMKPPQTLQFQGAAGAAQPGAGSSASGFGPSGAGNPQQGALGAQPGAAQGTTTGSSGTGQQGPQTTDTNAAGGSPNPNQPQPIDTSSFVGGNIIGIGSKITKPSIIIYEKATNYHLFEFIWDPSKDTLAIGGTGTQVGQPGFGRGNTAFGQGLGQGNTGTGQGQNTFGQPSTSPQPSSNPQGLPSTPPLSNGPTPQ
jgi:hypothetical protein